VAAVGGLAVEGPGETRVDDENDVSGLDPVDVAHDGLVRQQREMADVVLRAQCIGGNEEAFVEIVIEVSVSGEEDKQLVPRFELGRLSDCGPLRPGIRRSK